MTTVTMVSNNGSVARVLARGGQVQRRSRDHGAGL